MIELLITLFVGLFFLLGAFISLYSKNQKKLISFSVGISFVVLILLVFIDILPESIKLFSINKFLKIILGIIIGLGILYVLDKFIPHHNDNKKNNLVHVGIMTSIAIIIHNIIEGAGIYSVAQANLKAGLTYAFGVTLHNIPFGIKITAMLKDTKKNIMWIYISLLIISPLIGGISIYIFNDFLSDEIIGFILSITIGMIIYIIFFELFKLLKNNFNNYSIWGILIGILLMLIGVVI
ncbi:MAG: ZIP family metal transporter [Bacilli bacterium]|nr:ZIP family metal transporter [Bacilli bacterium]